MGVTKIWPVKDKLVRVLDYARDPEKTELKKLKAVQSRFGKTGGNVAYHAYQSFRTGEVTPELCHRLGVDLARQMWGDGYQVLVATHFNTGTCHNHFVVNSVCLWDGKKFDCNKRAYYRFRELSDRLCAEHCLTVIEKPQNRTPRNIYLAEKAGLPTRYNLMREAIDEAAAVSISRQEFVGEMKRLGYIVQAGPNRKYAAIRPIGSDRSTRMFRLGEGYDFPQVMDRVWADAGGKVRHRQQERYQPAQRKVITIPAQPMRMHGSFKKAKKVTGFMALCYHYCYLLGVLDRHKPKQQPLSPEMREACRKLDIYAKRIKVLAQYGLRTVPDVEAFIQVTGEKVAELTAQREKVRNRLRRCSDPEERKALTARQDRLTTQIKVLRDQNRTARDILAESGEMKRWLERVRIIPLEELRPFKDHPFKTLEGEEMDRLTESIRRFGSITPALARPLEEGGYELVSGHRRLEACRRLGKETMPVIVREMTDDEAVIAMVDANLQREAVRVPWERIRGSVPEGYDAKRREEFIVKACAYYAKYLRHQRDKDAPRYDLTEDLTEKEPTGTGHDLCKTAFDGSQVRRV